MKESPLKIHGALFLVTLIYSASYTISKDLMPYYIGPAGFILLRVIGGLLMIALYHSIFIREKVRNKKDLWHLLACAFFGVSLNMTMFFEGLSRTNPINAALIMVTTPIMVAIIGFLMKEEKFTWIKALGIALGTAGAMMLIASKGSNDHSDSILGDIFIAINAASYAVYLVIVKPLMKKYNPITVMLWAFFFGTFLVMPLGYKELSLARWSELSPGLWFDVVFTLIATTFLAYVLNAWTLRFVSSSVVGSYVYLQPVLGTLIAVATGKYILHLQQAIFAFVIFTGVYLVGKNDIPLEEETVIDKE